MIWLKQNKLVVVWLSVDKQAAIDMALLYARDSLLNGWWREVELILWGPSVEAAAQNEALQSELAMTQHLGIKVSACQACALRYGVTQKLLDLGIEVRGMGEHLTDCLKSQMPVLLI
jgi:hypothetical protein